MSYHISNKGYRKIIKFCAQNVADHDLESFSMNDFLNNQQYDLNQPSITLIIEGDHIAGRVAILTLYAADGGLK